MSDIACVHCGSMAGSMVCKPCRAEREAKHAEQLAAMDRTFRMIVGRAKERGSLDNVDQRWLESNGHGDTVKALEARFQRDKDGGKPKRQRGAD